MKKMVLKYLLSMVFLCYFAAVQALSLSDVELKSYLNQPLQARIVMGSVSAAELEGLEVRFIEPADSNTPGADITLTAEIVSDATGNYIQISSKQIIREPVLTFTLELGWSAGKIQREYSLLIDPKI